MNVIKPMNLLLPNRSINPSKWSVIACDQFTSDEKYWDNVFKSVLDSPSSYFVILPEVYLREDNSNVISMINGKMKEYLTNNVLVDIGKSFVLVDRKTPFTEHRLGLVMCIDLEKYSFNPEDKALVRATEKTITEKIPPRLALRKNADIEMSHVMLLFDDRKEKILENLYQNRENLQKLYDYDLNMEGGHITGYRVTDTESVINSFNKLLDENYLKETFATDEKILFAVGDGNHSLATAKAHWDSIKQTLPPDLREVHPARYTLVEVNNIQDEGLSFQPVHRVVYNADQSFVDGLVNLYKEVGNKTTIVYKGTKYLLNLPKETTEAVKLVQDYVEEYLTKHKESSVDYVHSFQDLMEVCRIRQNSAGVVMPKMDKNDFFPTILKKGLLSRKCFSIGEAKEKRYYMEAKRIK